MKTTHFDSPFQTGKEETLDALLGLGGSLLMLGTADGTYKLATSGDVATHILMRKDALNPNIEILSIYGGGVTCKVPAGGVIAKGARVMWGTGAKFVTAGTTTGTYRTFGRKLTQGSSATGDIIEILVGVEPIVIP
jgi:hypothetical protein